MARYIWDSIPRPLGAFVDYGRSFQAPFQHSFDPLPFEQAHFDDPIPLHLTLLKHIHNYEPPVLAAYYQVVEGYATMFLTFVLHTLLATAIAQGDFNHYIYAPDSRTVHPAGVRAVNGPISNADSLVGNSNGNAQFSGSSSITYDYGKNIGGIVSVNVGSVSSPDATLALTFSESSLYISNQSCDATTGPQFDEPLVLHVGQGPGTYTVENWHNRGGFRYLTITSNSNANIQVTSVSTAFTAAPNQPDLRHYRGYFGSNDELLNRIWYAGAYTNQLCTIDPHFGASTLHKWPGNGLKKRDTIPWYTNVTIANGSAVLTDGAKRDREIWAGDMTVSIPAVAVSTFDMDPIRNAISALLDLQHSDGMLPYAGFPFNTFNDVSFTYHLHCLISIAYYFHFSGDIAYAKGVWDHFTRAIDWSLGSIDSSGLMFVTSDKDWLRGGMGGHNIEANAILYYTLNQAITLANIVGDTASASKWGPIAAGVKSAANNLLWDAGANLYKDNENSGVYPQDGNVWAIKSGLTNSDSQNAAISTALKARWGKYGAPAPETGSPATVSPFIGSLELEAHFLANDPQTALDLMRLQWGFMLNDPRMTGSTFIEGYSENGDLHYPLYSSDAVISHSHGWSTGPTSALSFYVAGIQLVTGSGQQWRIAPRLGDLNWLESGYVTNLGSFYVDIKTNGQGKINFLRFHTPPGTSGSVSIPGVSGTLVSGWRKRGIPVTRQVNSINGEASNIPGGDWTLIPDS